MVAYEVEGAAIARRCWPGEAECSGAGGRGRSIWEREETMIQAVGGCYHSSKGEGRGDISGGRYGADACGADRCVDSACGFSVGSTMTSCSAAATVRRLAPMLST